MSERIQWTVGMLFALAFIAIVSVMSKDVVRYGNAVNNRVNNQVVAAENYELQSFNDVIVTGDTVRSAIKNQETFSNTNLKIVVDGTEYAAGANTDSIGLATKYKASLAFDSPDPDIVTGINFVRQ